MTRLFKWRPGALAWNTVRVTVWSLGRALIQALSLVLIARQFGAAGYGQLAGAVALYTALAQLVGAGSGVSLVRIGSREKGALGSQLRTTQILYVTTGILGFLLIWPLSAWVLPQELSLTLLAYLAAAELIAAPAILPAVYAYQAQERMGMFGFTLALAPLARLSVILICFFANTDLESFGLIYCATLFLVALTVAVRSLGWPTSKPVSLLDTLRSGIPYAITGVTSTAGSELDKTVMLRFQGAEVAGLYAAPFRVIQAAVLPVLSLALAASPRLFRAAATGTIHSAYPPLFLVTLGYAGVACLALYIGAPFLPLVFGTDFTASAEILKWMLPLCFLSCVRQVTGAILTGADMQWRRNWLEAISSIVSVTALLWLVPSHGVLGAIVAVSFSELLYILLALSALQKHRAIS